MAESSHNGLELSCKAQNRKILYDSHVVDSMRIIVHCNYILYKIFKLKAKFFLEIFQKIFSQMAGKLNLNFHLPGCPADTSQ